MLFLLTDKNEKLLLIYNIFWSILSSRFLTVPIFYAKLQYFTPISLLWVFFSVIACVKDSRGCVHPVCTCSVHCVIKKGNEMQCWAGNKRILHWCEQNYSGARFIAPFPDPNPIPNPSTYPIGYWGNNTRSSYGSTISQPRFISNH